MGDYLGDLSLLQAADIGYAVENALPEVKAVAHRLTIHARDAAAAAVIAQLEAELESQKGSA